MTELPEIVVKGAAPSRKPERRGLLAAAGAGLVMAGSLALPEAQGSINLASEGRKIAFATRVEEPVRPSEAPLPYENRRESPRPILPFAQAETIPPPPETAAAPAQEHRELVSFDNKKVLVSGSWGPNSEPEPERRAEPSRAWPPPPAQWNNPIQWIRTHDASL